MIARIIAEGRIVLEVKGRFMKYLDCTEIFEGKNNITANIWYI